MRAKKPTGYSLVVGPTVALLASLLASTAYATNYYISPIGSDSNSGTSASAPWQTVTKVNATQFKAGDTLMIDAAHGALTGCFSFTNNNVHSTATDPFTITAYDGAQWTLLSGCGVNGQYIAAVLIDSVSGILLENGILSGNNTHTMDGVWIRNYNLPVAADNIVVRNMDISNFNTTVTSTYSAEVFVTGWPGNGITNVKILNNKLHGLTPTSPDDGGITGYGGGGPITVVYANNEIYNLGSRPGAPPGPSGSAIWCNGTSSCIVDHNYIHNNSANVTTCGGSTGIGTWFATNSHIYDNEVAYQQAKSWPATACDFSALDADGGSVNSLWERNYTHDNDGPAILFGGSPPEQPWSNNTFRLNISENDNLTNNDGGGVWALSPVSGGYVYNNTAYRSIGNGSSVPYCVSLGWNGQYGPNLVENNSCEITSSAGMWGYTGGVTDDNSGYNQSSVTFENNDYDLGGSQMFSWQGQSYNLAGFQSATHEGAGSMAANPLFLAPGQGGSCNGVLGKGCPSAYHVMVGSPAIGAGGLITAKLALPGKDYYGNPFKASQKYSMGVDSAAVQAAIVRDAGLASHSTSGN